MGEIEFEYSEMMKFGLKWQRGKTVKIFKDAPTS